MSGAVAGTPLRFADGKVRVRAKPSEVPPAQLEALRRHKDTLAPIVEAFGADEPVEVLIRPAHEPAEPYEVRLERTLRRYGVRRRGRRSMTHTHGLAASGVARRRAGKGR